MKQSMTLTLGLLKGFGYNMTLAKIMVDNKSTIELAKNLVFHGHFKDIKIRYHCIKKCIENSEVELHHVTIEEQHADI